MSSFTLPVEGQLCLLCTDRRHGRYDLLLATNDFDNEALAIEVALLIEGDIQQNPWIVLGRDFRSMQRCSQRLGIEFADLLRHGLNDADGTIAFHRVMIGPLLVFFQILLVERLYRSLRRIRCQSDVAQYSIGRITGQFDNFLSDDRGFAADGLVESLLLQFSKHPGALLFRKVGKQRISIALLYLQSWPGEVYLAWVCRNVCKHLDVLRAQTFHHLVPPPLSKVVVGEGNRD